MQYGLQEARNTRVLYVDMNAFFASIEQQYRPELRIRPLAVVSHQTASGTVLASSYEAKACQVTTGTKLREAMLRCPDLAVVETDAIRYKSVHRRLHSLLVSLFGPEAVHMRSIDEAAIFLAPSLQVSSTAHALARSVKEACRIQLGEYIRCSIGIAPNQLLAKLATDLQKPDGLVEITLENLPAILASLPITALPGIAEANARRLLLHGITTPYEFATTPAANLQSWFGIWGQYWWWRLHGYEADSSDSSLQSSFSHEHILKRWLNRKQDGYPTLSLMAERLVHRLRRNHYACQGVSLSVSSVGYPRFIHERRLDAPSASYSLLVHTFRNLYEELPDQFPAPVRKFTLTLYRLSQTQGVQADIFGEQLHGERIGQTVEAIRLRHGFSAIQTASSLAASQNRSLKEQPGFGKIRDARSY